MILTWKSYHPYRYELALFSRAMLIFERFASNKPIICAATYNQKRMQAKCNSLTAMICRWRGFIRILRWCISLEWG